MKNGKKYIDKPCLGCGKIMKLVHHNTLYCTDCMKKRKPIYSRKFRKEHKEEIKIPKGDFICRECGKKEKRIMYRQRMCSNCSQKSKQRQHNKNRKRMNQLKGKTYEERYGKKKAKRVLENFKKGIKSKNIICEDCGKKVQRTATRHKFCKECSRKRENKIKSNYRKNNLEKCKKFKKEYSIKNKEKIKVKSSEYYLKNKDKINKYSSKWAKENKDKRNKTKRNWRKNNPFKVKLEKLRRRARHNSINEIFTSKEWFKKLDKTKGICPKCNKFIGKNKLTLDHIIPISKVPKGFTYTIDDVQPLCRSCNSKKRDKIGVI